MMKINPYQTMNPYCPAPRFSPGASRLAADPATDRQPGNPDRLTISLYGQNSRIEELIKQKHSLLERKNELIRSTLENGGSRESIQELLDTYAEQMKNLDQQISREMASLNTDQTDKDSSISKNNAPKTKEELRKKQISDLVDLSSGLSQVKSIQSARTSVEGEARVLESEIRMDKGRGGDPEAIARRGEKLADLQQRAAGLSADIMKASRDIAEQIDESHRTAEETVREEMPPEQTGHDSLTDVLR